MKNRFGKILWLSPVLVLVLAACSSTPTPVGTVVVQPTAIKQATSTPTKAVILSTATMKATAAPAVQPTAQKLTDAEMQAFLLEKLIGSPHTLEFVLSQEKTREEWDKTITKMIGKGAKINEEEKQLLIDWLVSQ